MDILRTTDPQEALRESKRLLAGAEGVIVCVNDDVFCETGPFETLNRRECERRGIYVAEAIYQGGTIVNMPGDLSICITTWGRSELAPRIVDRAAAWLADFAEISRDRNDVLADGRKVISWARATTIDGWCQSVAHFSVGPMDLALVAAICTKPMEKVPGALSEYGISAEDIWEIIKDIITEEV